MATITENRKNNQITERAAFVDNRLVIGLNYKCGKLEKNKMYK